MIFFLFLFFLPEIGRTQGFVSEIYSSNSLVATQMDPQVFKEGDKVLIASHQEKKILGFGKISKLGEGISDNPGKIEIIEIINNSLISTGDVIFPLDLNVLKELNVPGFFSLTMSGDNQIPARYKELAYFGVFTSEGHTLDRHEVLVSPFQVQYGLRDNIGIKVVSALFLDGYANLGLKYQALKNKYVKFTPNTFVAYKVSGNKDWIWQLGGVLTTTKNIKFQNHLMFNFTMDKQFINAKATENLGLYQDSDIRSITEYITDG